MYQNHSVQTAKYLICNITAAMDSCHLSDHVSIRRKSSKHEPIILNLYVIRVTTRIWLFKVNSILSMNINILILVVITRIMVN